MTPRIRVVVAALVAFAAVGVAGWALGQGVSPTDSARVGPSGGGSFVRNSAPSTTDSTDFVQVPGAVTSVRVPEGRWAVWARFSAESLCEGALEETACSVRIQIGDETGDPIGGNDDFAFDSTGSDGRESHTMERSRFFFESGRYPVKVQYRVGAASASFQLDDWTLFVERMRIKR